MQTPTDVTESLSERFGGRRWVAFEVLCIVAVFFIAAGSPPPDVNEAHYLGKANHYWDPSWCAGDLFLDSADAHAVFYWTFGWLTAWLSLPEVAWIGRVITWVGLAVALRRLTRTMVRQPFASVWVAICFLLLSRWGHLAGEWVVGGVEAKGFSYILVLFGLGDLVRGRWRSVWIWFGLASAFHVIVGGWSVLAAGVVRVCDRRRNPLKRSEMAAVLAGGLLALPGLLPAMWLSGSADPATVAEANQIYVFERLPHHLSILHMAPIRMISHGALLIAAACIWWRVRTDRVWGRLARFAIACSCISGAGLAIDLLLANAPVWGAKLLRFYWCRLADVLLPLSVATGLAVWLAMESARPSRRATVSWAIAIVGAGLFVVSLAVEHRDDLRPGALQQSAPFERVGRKRGLGRARQWREICAWIRQRTPADARFLTPRGQQTFKWYAQRAEVVAWKDIPQDPAGIVAWYRRMQSIYPADVVRNGLGAWTDRQLLQIAARYKARYVLVDHGRTRRRLGFRRVYPYPSVRFPTFELYDLGALQENVAE